MSAGGMRLFFALWPDRELAAATHQLARTLCGTLPVKLVPAHRLHMTLQFLGSRVSDELTRIEAAAGRVRGRQFELLLDRAGHWRRAGVTWLAPGEAPSALLELVARLRKALVDIGLPAETRPFRPHVTLARKMPRAPAQPWQGRLRWQVDHFRLVRSVTHSSGAEYSEIARWPLAD